MQRLRGIWLGRRRYAEVHALQERLLEARRRGEGSDTVLLLEHEPVITLGRGTRPGHVLAGAPELLRRGVELVEIARGGDVTLHAPGQLVAYPIVALTAEHRDVRRYVAMLAEAMRRVVASHGVEGGTFPGHVGLWVDAESPGSWLGPERARRLAKIGAIGVRISRWVTMHGFALNLGTDLGLFELIVPCGIREYPVTSLQALSAPVPSTFCAAEQAHGELSQLFGAHREPMIDAADAAIEDWDST